jgi:transcriptional regulator with XRE-family HTH domain
MAIKQLAVFVENGVSIAKIAEKSGFSVPTVSRWLKGTRQAVREETEKSIELALEEIAKNILEVMK